MAGRDVMNLVAAALALAAGGCGTMENFNHGFAKQQAEWHGGVPRYYGGVRMSLEEGSNLLWAHHWNAECWQESLGMAAILTIDFPVTVLADTLTLAHVYVAQQRAAAWRGRPAPLEGSEHILSTPGRVSR